MPPGQRPSATFGVWYDVNNQGCFAFRRWLKEDEAGKYLSLEAAAQIFLDQGGPRGNELELGRYMIQRLDRGTSGEAIQAFTFNAVAAPQPLLVKPDTV